MLLVMRVLSIVPLNFKVSRPLFHEDMSIGFIVGWNFFEPVYLPLFLHYICVSVLRWRTTDPDYFIFGYAHVRFRWHAFRGGSRPATTLPSP